VIEPVHADIGRRVKVACGDGETREGKLLSIGHVYVVVRLDGLDTPVRPSECEWAGGRAARQEGARAIAARSVFEHAGLRIEAENDLAWRVEGYFYSVEGGNWVSPDGQESGLNASDLVKHWRKAQAAARETGS
jgi:hypothetical protein